MRLALATAAVVAAGLLAIAEAAVLYDVRAGGLVIAHTTAGAHHGYALAPIAAGAFVLGVLAAWRGIPAANAALAVLGAAALAIALIADLPAAISTGLSGELATASAHPDAGLWLELAGATLTLAVAAAIRVAWGRTPRPVRAPAPPDRPAHPDRPGGAI